MTTPVVTPTAGVDPRTALSTSLHAAPGVYAVLVGSGMSSAAGIPTTWKVVQDLIRKVAIAEGADPNEWQESPEVWWSNKGHPEPRYDTLLPMLAPTDAARQILPRHYFDPLPSKGGPGQPSAAHHALAQLCVSGRVRLILTTNFDRLIERALDQAGISPQVVASPGAVAGMIPLVHAPTTVVKLHGDYATLGLRNTPEELEQYPQEWQELLRRVFDEYGLIVLGWSADYDVALAEAMSSCPTRRYPMFWTAFHGSLTESARRLIALRQATVIDTTGADEFLTDLTQQIQRLDEVAARRGRPRTLRNYSHAPHPSAAPEGWAVLPLLQLRAVGVVGPASIDSCGIIRPRNRHALLEALRTAPATMRVWSLAAFPHASAAAQAPSANARVQAPPLVGWEPTPGTHQSTDYASYRLGGDGTVGVSSLITVTLPRFGSPTAGSAVFTTDVGLSLANTVRLGDATAVLRDC